MTDTLADALPREIARVSAKRDRWRDMMRDHPDLRPALLATARLEHAVREMRKDDST